MPAAAVALANRRQIMPRLFRRPRIRADRNLGAETRRAHRNRISALRIQVIRDELVVAFQIVAGQIEGNHAARFAGAVANDMQRFQMPLIKRLEKLLNIGLLDNLLQRHMLHVPDDPLHHIRTLRALDHQRQLHGRRAQFHGRFRIRILRAIDDIRPVHQIVEIRRRKAPLLASPWCEMKFVHDLNDGSYIFFSRMLRLEMAARLPASETRSDDGRTTRSASGCWNT